MTINRRTVSAALAMGVAAAGTKVLAQAPAPRSGPMPVVIAGLTHGHAHWIFQSAKRGDITIAGVAETDRELAKRYLDQYGLSMDLVHADLATLLDAVHPVAVAGYNAVGQHVEIVRVAAPRGIHVMVEKPLAATLKQAEEMAALARKHNIHLLTNYETSWYATVAETKALLREGTAIGRLRKAVFHDGHKGPKEIGVGPEFLSWLTDPVLNGGGAIVDFGCYGANLMTWFNDGAKPVAVTAVTRQFKPDVYPKVDDDATIVVDYAGQQAIIQASWNWPVGRKDMELYGTDAQIVADDRAVMRIRKEGPDGTKSMTLPDRAAPYNDSSPYFCAVIEGRVKPEPFDPSSLENNMVVMRILDAAIRSAKSGKTVKLKA